MHRGRGRTGRDGRGKSTQRSLGSSLHYPDRLFQAVVAVEEVAVEGEDGVEAAEEE